MSEQVSTKLPDQKCIWCEEKKTYFMGEDGWFRYFHCPTCSADFPINMQSVAWTEDEIKVQHKIETDG